MGSALDGSTPDLLGPDGMKPFDDAAVSQDAPVSESEASLSDTVNLDGASGFCATAPANLFCDDFDQPTLRSDWFVEQVDGVLRLDSAKFVSPPRSIYMARFPDAGGTGTLAIGKAFATGSFSEWRVGFDYWRGAGTDHLVAIEGVDSSNVAWAINLDQALVRIAYPTSKATFALSLPPEAAWHRFEVRIARPSGAATDSPITVYRDGALGASGTIANTIFTSQSFRFTFGPHSVFAGVSSEGWTDNVLVQGMP